MASLTFYGGVGQIGGNMILLESGSTRLFIDFGKKFADERRFFDEPYLSPREEKHLLALGILPGIPGIYKKDSGEHNLDAVVLSHAHADHMDYIRYLKDDIPIYCGETTRRVILAREKSGRSPSTEYEIAALTQREERIRKSFRVLSLESPNKVKDLAIQALPVDHSIPGALGLIAHTPEGAVVYTGDFRCHGFHGEATTEAFLKKASGAKPKAMIIEGTNIVNARPSNEDEVRAKLTDAVKACSGLVMAGFSGVDLDRLQTFHQVARATGRKLVVSMKQAFLLMELDDLSPLRLEDIWVFQREKKRTVEWEKRVLARVGDASILESAQVGGEQAALIMAASFYDMNETVEIQPIPGSIYILSQSEPFNEEMELDFDKLLNWLDRYGMPLYNIHASGHALPEDLKRMVREVAPEKAFLIHTERPELYKRYLGDITRSEIICPELGKDYDL